jgi:hypothetical protein
MVLAVASRGVAGIHIAQMDFPFVRYGSPAEQRAILVEESNFY